MLVGKGTPGMRVGEGGTGGIDDGSEGGDEKKADGRIHEWDLCYC